MDEQKGGLTTAFRFNLSLTCSLSEFEEHPLEKLTLVRDSLLLVELFERVDHRLDVLAVQLDGVQKVEDLVEGAVGQDEHVLRQSLDQTQ